MNLKKVISIGISLLFLAPLGVSAAYNSVTPYFANNTTDAIVNVPVKSGDTIEMEWWGINDANSCSGQNNNIAENFYIPSWGATTTIYQPGERATSGLFHCFASGFYELVATTTENWSIEAKNQNGNWTAFQVAVTDYSTASSSSSGGTNTIATQSFATTSQNALVLDNPTQDLFEGILIMLLVSGGIIWVFKKR